ncbi:DNA polymerase III subunit gamma and tau [Arthrobacter sp. SDTb3-6]|uniref:DNA polymerase III subunit gamma and tau n=1 Tax=Arthrobacter sp. SDTb3-6 TaxID=2713571 RepID=UPI00159D1FFF|nr:DNA polymerase III subunit gamma and tau [Arthrobacter sp. SDTb3-6]
MSAPTALYRRYRPDSFADVIGQEHVTAPLMAALEKNRVNHAYLFSGPRGCGKTTSARILARCLNCAQGPTSHPCGECDSCIELARGGAGSLDVIEIDAASHGGVDDARDLRERATFAPIRDRYKIFIIDEAHMVTSAGFNALLKIVEEPPEHIKFIFATTEPDKVIGTIRSRTHHYPFRLVPPEPLMAYLARLCEQEGVPVAPGVLSLVIRAGGGSVRDSLSVLDQLMAGAGAAGLDYELAVDLLGYTHASLLDDVVEALAAADAATVFKSVDRVIQTGHDPRRFVEDLLERFRDLIIVQAMPESAHAILRGTPDELIARMQTQAAQLGASELSRAADVTNSAFNEMTGATSPRLHLELLGARLLLPGADASARGMASRLDAMERRLNYGGAPAGTDSGPGLEAAATAPSTMPTPMDAPPVAPGGGLAAVRAQLAKAKADAGAQVASRHPERVQHAPVPAGEAPVPAGEGPVPAGEGPSGVPAGPSGEPEERQDRPDPAPHRQPTWGDLDVAPAPEPPAPQPDAGPWHTTAPSSRLADAGHRATPRQQASAPAAAPQETAVGEPAAPPVQQASAPTGPGPGPASGGTGIEVIRRAWPEILANLSNIRKASWAMVNQNVVPRAFDGETLRVALPTTALIQTFGNSGHAENLRQAIHTTLGISCRLDPITGDAPNPGSSAEPNPKEPADPGPPGSAGRPPLGQAPATAAAGNTPPYGAAPAMPAPAGPSAGGTSPSPAAQPRPTAPVPARQPDLAPQPARAQAVAPSAASPAVEATPTPHPAPAAAPAAAPAPAPSAPETRNGQPAGGARPGVRVSEWDGPIPEEPSWDDEPPFDDWSEPVPPQFRESAPPPGGPHPARAQQPPAAPGQALPAPAPSSEPAREQQPSAAAVAAQAGSANSATGPAPAAAPEPYRPKVSPISAWTTGWDMPSDQPSEAPASAPEEPAVPRRSQLLAAQAGQSAGRNNQQDAPQDWGVSLGGPSRNTVADPGWGAPAEAPDWATPAPSPAGTAAPGANSAQPGTGSRDLGSTDAAPAGTTQAPPGAPAAAPRPGTPAAAPRNGDTPAAPTRDGGQDVSGGTPSSEARQAPAAGEKLSMYQRLSNSAEAQAGRSRVQARPADAPYVEDVPSEDDVTIEESGVAGQAAVERILGGQLVEERPLHGSSY